MFLLISTRTQEPKEWGMCISPKEYYINGNKNPPKMSSCIAVHKNPTKMYYNGEP